MPVKAVAVFARQSDIGLLVPADAGISGPAQLKGKKVAYTAGSLEAPIDAFLAAGKLKKSDLELINVDAASKASTYAVGRADAAFSTIRSSCRWCRRPAVERSALRRLRPEHAQLRPVRQRVQAGSAARRHRALRQRERAGLGYIYAGHQDEAVAAILAQRPQSRLDRKVLRGQIDALQPYFGQPAAGARLGAIVPQDWTQAVATLSTVGLIGADAQAASFYEPGLVHAERYDSLVQP